MPDQNQMQAFEYGGLVSLINSIKNIRTTANGAYRDVSDLQTDFSELVEKLNDVLNEVGGAIQSLDTSKAHIAARKEFALPVFAWGESRAGDAESFPYSASLSIEGVTAEARVDVVLDAESSIVAGKAGVAPVSDSANGAVVFKSKEIPLGRLSGELYITQGAEEGDANNENEGG